jgi:hypothetical protein
MESNQPLAQFTNANFGLVAHEERRVLQIVAVVIPRFFAEAVEAEKAPPALRQRPKLYPTAARIALPPSLAIQAT